MPIDVEQQVVPGSSELATAITRVDFSQASATVIGYGNMGRHHVRALRALGVGRVRVCSRSRGALEELQRLADVTILDGGVEQLSCVPKPGELGLIATPVSLSATAARALVTLGFRRLLIEKPVSLRSKEIESLASELDRQGVKASCAYNRAAYPSLVELRALAVRDGGITSCTYCCTEMVKPDWPQRFPAEELARWGIANSLHVVSMAHALIGRPASWNSCQAGSLPWHPTGAAFVGSGISDQGIPFACHADWTSPGRWALEVQTRQAAYRCCPLEKLERKTSPLGAWEEVEVTMFAPEIKPGFIEQAAAMLNDEIGALLPLISLREAARLTRYGEGLFGYPPRRASGRVSALQVAKSGGF